MKFNIVKDFAQPELKFQDKTKNTEGVWEYITDGGEKLPVEANTCYFIKSYTEVGGFNIAVSDDKKEVRFLFHNTNIGQY